MAITYFYLIAATHSQALVGSIPRAIQYVVAFGLTATTAVVWEFLEFCSDLALATKMNLGVADTLADLFFGLIGGVVVIVMLSRSARLATITPTGATNA